MQQVNPPVIGRSNLHLVLNHIIDQLEFSLGNLDDFLNQTSA
jgi:hypothetical protein